MSETVSVPLETVAMRVGEGGPAFDLAHRLGVYDHWDHEADIPVYRRWQIDAIEAWLAGRPWPSLAAASPAPVDEPKPADDLVERAEAEALRIIDDEGWNMLSGAEVRMLRRSIAASIIRTAVAERKKVEELGERVDELEGYGEMVAAEFEGDCWKAVRRLLEKTHFDFSGDPVTADEAEEYLRECIKDAEFRNRVLSETVDRLRKALEPFGKHHMAAMLLVGERRSYDDDVGLVRASDLRAARTALEQS